MICLAATSLSRLPEASPPKTDDLPQGDDLNTVLDAAAGLTRYEAEGAYSLSIVRHGNIRPDAIWELKSQTLKKSGLLQLHRGGERFDGLGGLQSLKSFTLRAMRRQGHRDPLRRPRGVLLAGRSRHGEVRVSPRPLVRNGQADIDSRHRLADGFFVGSTEANIRQALKIIDAMEPCICFIDEVEKALSGVSSSGDSGVVRPFVWHVPDLAERPPERCLYDLHLQRYLQAAAGVLSGGAVRRMFLPRPAQQRATAEDLGYLPEAVRS